MANELSITASLSFADSEGTDETLDVSEYELTISTKKYIKAKISVGTSEEALPLGEVSSLGYCFFKNLDETNYVEIRSGTGASNDVIKVGPLGIALFRFGSDVTAPYVIANTAACQCEYILVSN